MQQATLTWTQRELQKPAASLVQRIVSWTMIAGFGLLMLFLGSCPHGAMAGTASQDVSDGGWWYQCPIIQAVIPAEPAPPGGAPTVP